MRSALLEYIRALEAGREVTNKPEERVAYTHHLAEAARILAALEFGTPEPLTALVRNQQRAHGWSFLSGEHGSRAESAFAAFASLVPGIATAAHSERK